MSLKKQTLQFFGEKFNIDLHEHPEEWEKFARAQQIALSTKANREEAKGCSENGL